MRFWLPIMIKDIFKFHQIGGKSTQNNGCSGGTYIFHHVTAFTFSFTEFPVQTQLRRARKQNKTDPFSTPLLCKPRQRRTHIRAHACTRREKRMSESALQGLSGLTEVKMWPDTLKTFLYVSAQLLAAICCCETKPNEHGHLRLTSRFCQTPKHSICPEQLRGANVAG